MMNYGKKAMAGASQMGGQAVAGAKSMMAPKAPAAPAKPGMFSKMANAVKAKMPGKK
jgi:hypothetical protein